MPIVIKTPADIDAMRNAGRLLGPFRDEHMWTIQELEALVAGGGEPALDRVLYPPHRALRDWPAVTLGAAEQAYVLQGQAVFAVAPGGARVRLYGPGGVFLGVGEAGPEGPPTVRGLGERGGPRSCIARG